MNLKQKLKNISKELQGSTFSSADDYAERVAKRAIELFMQRVEWMLQERSCACLSDCRELAKEVLNGV